MSETNNSSDNTDLTNELIASLPKELVVGYRCARGRDRICSYGKYCICAEDEATWLRINEPALPTKNNDA